MPWYDSVCRIKCAIQRFGPCTSFNTRSCGLCVDGGGGVLWCGGGVCVCVRARVCVCVCACMEGQARYGNVAQTVRWDTCYLLLTVV